MKYSLVKFLLIGLFSKYVVSSSVYREEEKSIKNDQPNVIEEEYPVTLDEKIDEVLNINEEDDIYANYTSTTINPKYNNKPVQSILIQLANSDVLKTEELDKIANELAEKHGLPTPIPIGELKGHYKFDITGSIRSSLQKRRIKRHIKRLNDNTEVVKWVDLDRNVKLSKRSIALTDFRDPLAQSQWNIVIFIFIFDIIKFSLENY